MRRLLLLSSAAFLGLSVGCATLQLTTIKTTQQRPSNVAIYFKVQTSSGDPVGGLTADRFRIYEDDQLVSEYESKQTIVNPEVAAVHYTLLLVDMSGSVSGSGSVAELVQAAGTFTDRVEKASKVGIYAFDGSQDLYPIVPFTDQPVNAKAGVASLSMFKPKDPSTNLNGAVVKALDTLDAALARASQPLRFGTLVVFTDGTDRANRVSEYAMLQRVRETPFEVFAIGLGAEIKEWLLDDIGKNGTAMAADKSAIVKAFDEIGSKVEGRTRSFYLLSYCSPARAGRHDLRIQALVVDSKGREQLSGSVTSEFDATGFAPGCDPNAPPNFDLTKGDALSPPASASAAPPSAPPPSEKSNPPEPEKEPQAEAKRATRKAPSSPAPPKLPPPPPPESPPPTPPSQQDFNP